MPFDMTDRPRNGIPLAVYAETLRRVPAHVTRDPALHVAKLVMANEGIAAERRYEEITETSVCAIARRMSLERLKPLGFDAICKLRFSSSIMMRRDVEALFDDVPAYRLVHKIQNSAWRTGCGRMGWNDLVDAHEGIRRFDFGLPGFTVTLDHTIGHNERAQTDYGDTYLDGVFGFLVHHQGKHVLTLGFTIASGRRVLVKQVQAKAAKGNRWMFKLPEGVLAHALGRFAAAFPKHSILVIDGGCLAERAARNYGDSADHAEERLAVLRGRAARDPDATRHVDEAATRLRDLRGKEMAAGEDATRLRALYASTGRHQLGKSVRIASDDYRLVHIAPPSD